MKYEICEVASYITLVKELSSKRAALTISGLYLSALNLKTLTYINPSITSYTLSLLTRMLLSDTVCKE